MPIDQIIETDNLQDGMAVLCCVEAVLIAIILAFLFLREVILISDNAGCYHKTELVLSIPLLVATIPTLQVSWILHTETQDEKGVTDTCFDVSGAQVN